MGKTLVYWKWLKKEPNAYVEWGIDREHHKNKRVFGFSTEINNPDGSEFRVFGKVPIKTCEIYLRIWIGRFVICFGSGSFSMRIKDKRRFKIVLGRSGILKQEISELQPPAAEISDTETSNVENQPIEISEENNNKEE